MSSAARSRKHGTGHSLLESIGDFFNNMMRRPETKEAINGLSTDPDFNADEFLSKLSQQEAKFWLEIVVKDICEDKKIELDYKTLFEEVINNDNLDATKKVEEVSRIFRDIINKEHNQTKKEALIHRIGVTSDLFHEHSKKQLWEQQKKIGLILACTITVAFVVLNIVSAVFGMMYKLATMAAIGLVGYAAAKKAASAETDRVLEQYSPTADSISSSLAATGEAIKKTGITDILYAVAAACMGYAVINPFSLKTLYTQYKDLTDATLGAERLVGLADNLGKEHGMEARPKHKRR